MWVQNHPVSQDSFKSLLSIAWCWMRKKYSPVYPVAVRVAAAFYALKRR